MRFLIIFCFLWIPLSTIVFITLPGNTQITTPKKKKKKKKKKGEEEEEEQ
jgi:predicted membrane protein